MTRVLWRTMASAGEGTGHLSEARRCGLAHIQRVIDQLSAYLGTQAARGALRVPSPVVAARMLVGGMLILLRMSGLEDLSREELVRQVAAVYIYGLLPGTATRDAPYLAVALPASP